MFKKLLKEIYDALGHLNDAGYFGETKTKERKQRVRNHRGPDMSPRVKGNKLFPYEVLEIYKDAKSCYHDLAYEYNVTTKTIHDIKSGRSWSKVTGHKG